LSLGIAVDHQNRPSDLPGKISQNSPKLQGSGKISTKKKEKRGYF